MSVTSTRSRTLAFMATLALAATAGLTAGLTSVALGSAADAATGRTESPIPADPRTPGVRASMVTISAPLPASFRAHPAACDKLSYLRYRSASGPSSAAAADKIMVAQPGALAGASSLDLIARRTIQDARATGHNIEFWALDRRANCLEDNAGLTAAVAAGDPSLALNYYARGGTVNGKRFAGYFGNDQLAWLQKMGMQQTVDDEHTLVTKELPDARVRASKVWCGGHSLGGIITAFYSMSDFDGSPATLGDAGYNQCAGYFALDTKITTTFSGDLPEPAAMDGIVARGKQAVGAAYAAGILPYALNIPVVNPESINLLAIAGAYAKTKPRSLSPLPSSFRDNSTVSLSLKVLLSKDLGTFISAWPDITKVRITNQAALGALMDDNSSPIALVQESAGFFTGGRIVDKSFPLPNDVTNDPELSGLNGLATGTQKKATPDDVGPIWNAGTGPVYSWLNYNQVAKDGSNVPKSSVDGKPFTTAASEVTDVNDLSTVLSAYPLDFTEHYFPLAMLTDTALWSAGDRSVVPTAIHPTGLTAHPIVNVWGGEGFVLPLFKGQPLPANTLVLPGYQHLDVLTAAATQNDGTPEKGAAYLADFVLTH